MGGPTVLPLGVEGFTNGGMQWCDDRWTIWPEKRGAVGKGPKKAKYCICQV